MNNAQTAIAENVPKTTYVDNGAGICPTLIFNAGIGKIPTFSIIHNNVGQTNPQIHIGIISNGLNAIGAP